MAPNTVGLTEWVVASQDDEKKRDEPKIPVVMKPNITLKVAQAVRNEGASFSAASLGRSHWEWQLEVDASSAECGSSANHDSSTGNTCCKTPPLEIFSCLANSLAICEFLVDSWIPRPLVEFLGLQSKLVGPKMVTHGRPCSRSARKFWCCPWLRKCSRYCMQGWTMLGYQRTLGNCAWKLCS